VPAIIAGAAVVADLRLVGERDPAIGMGCSRSWRVSDRPAVTVAKSAEVTMEVLPPLTSSAAIEAFLELLQGWKLPPAQAWRMLTGVGYRAGSLTPDQIVRVQHLVAIDTGMRLIKGDGAGEWMGGRQRRRRAVRIFASRFSNPGRHSGLRGAGAAGGLPLNCAACSRAPQMQQVRQHSRRALSCLRISSFGEPQTVPAARGAKTREPYL
jgi:hypothetical protein